MKKLILSGLTVAILFIASPLGHLNAQTPIIQHSLICTFSSPYG